MKHKIFAILALPPPPSRREAYEYAERIMARLPHRLRELRLALGLDALNWSMRQLLGGNSGMTVAAVWADGVLRNASGNAFVPLDGNDLHLGNWRIQPQGLVQHEISTVPDNAVDLANGVLAVYVMGGFQTVASWATGTLKDGAGNAFSTGAYSPANPGHWAGTPPATVAEAMDRLAALASNTGANPIP